MQVDPSIVSLKTSSQQSTDLHVLRNARILAATHAVFMVWLGFFLLGPLPTIFFASGFLGGFVLWVLFPERSQFEDLMGPYFLALALFAVHKLEQRDFEPLSALFQPAALPLSASYLFLAFLALAAAWLFIPLLMQSSAAFGHYLAWTFFALMSVMEPAHFILPLFQENVARDLQRTTSVLVLAPVAWWGLYRMTRRHSPQSISRDY